MDNRLTVISCLISKKTNINGLSDLKKKKKKSVLSFVRKKNIFIVVVYM